MIKIPDEISILHVEYKVIQVPVIDKGDGDGFILGNVNFTNNTIQIDQGLCDTLKLQTLIHEIMHAVFFQTGQSEAQNNEAVCQAAAAGLMSVIAGLMSVIQENDLKDEADQKIWNAKLDRAVDAMALLGKKTTNYEKLMNEMTLRKMAEIIDEDTNPCLMCVCRDQTYCKYSCREGIEKWLKQEADDAAD